MALAGRLCVAATIFLIAQILLAERAGADTTISAAEVCHQYSPGLPTRVVHIGRNYGACVVVSAAPGLFSAPIPIATIMASKHVGSYPVNRADPFSAWIIPTGS